MKKIAIVGSEGKNWTPVQRTKVVRQIRDIFEKTDVHLYGDIVQDAMLISGGCGYTACDCSNYLPPGVDEWAEIVIDVLGYPKDIHYAPAGQWNDKIEIVYETDRGNLERELKGYQTRNKEIAKLCDVLYCFDPKWRGEKTGGQWTMRYAAKLGKEVHLVQIE